MVAPDGSAAQRHHWIRLTQSVAETLCHAAKDNPGEAVNFLAYGATQMRMTGLSTPAIPAAVVDQMDAQLPAGVEDKRRNLTIRRNLADERWY